MVMDKRVYFLTIISFIVGMVELIIGGILDLIATDLHVSLGQAGFLITIFSLIFAVAAPILLILTAKVERKQLTLISLLIFLLGNIVTVFSPNYMVLFIGRIISATSGSLLIILCLTMAPSIVDPKYRGRAIGIVSMGVSASLVLGIPIGLMLGNAFGWRAPFVLISFLTVLSIIAIYLFMDKVEPKPSIPIRKQLATLKNRKVFFAQTTTFLFLAHHPVCLFDPVCKSNYGDRSYLGKYYLSNLWDSSCKWRRIWRYVGRFNGHKTYDSNSYHCVWICNFCHSTYNLFLAVISGCDDCLGYDELGDFTSNAKLSD